MVLVRRIGTLLIAIGFFAALFAIGPLTGSGQLGSVVDLSGDVVPENCAPCHAAPGASDVPGLIFDHSTHLLAACDACHTAPPHAAGGLLRPTMQSCFSCHGMIHSSQGTLAAGECADCHTPQHTLRPKTHVEDWAMEPHAVVSRADGVNGCMMCHKAPDDCDACHRELGLDIGPMPQVYLRTLPIPPELPGLLVDTAATPTMSACAYCHDGIDDFDDPDLIFVHDPHIRRDYKCAACHEVFPHTPEGTLAPDMLSCYRCHSLTHSAWGPVAPEECADCHPPDFELVPADHTPAFRIGEHADAAEVLTESCMMCHASTFCEECHTGGRLMANGQPSPQVIPASHTTPEWQPEHGRQFLGQQGACSTCHVSDSCIRCHFTPMPHPADWLVVHTKNGFSRLDCTVCHTDRSDCQDCHHRDLESQELIAANCIECHEEMKTDPPTAIKNIALAEHAVHFNVAERVGRVYVCDDCHIGFTMMRVMQPASMTQAHDLRMCYDCHGALDTRKVLIAPWPGSELCRRCHTDLSL